MGNFPVRRVLREAPFFVSGQSRRWEQVLFLNDRARLIDNGQVWVSNASPVLVGDALAVAAAAQSHGLKPTPSARLVRSLFLGPGKVDDKLEPTVEQVRLRLIKVGDLLEGWWGRKNWIQLTRESIGPP